MATNKDLRRWYDGATHSKRGYVCYQEDGLSKFDLIELGYNHGIYGWNWTAYFNPKTDTLYISCYRNVPANLIDK